MPLNIHLGVGETTRRCGECTLCCKLLPVDDLGKKAGQRCVHQRTGKGCAVYRNVAKGFPRSCFFWNCRWLVNDDTADLRRPDRSHYVIDLLPDFVTIRDDKTGKKEHVEVVQVWVDPKHPDAHRDPALRAYLERRAAEGKAALIRWDNLRAIALFAPSISSNGQWNEVESDFRVQQHTIEEIVAALG